MYRVITEELRNHAPFTVFGALTGILLMVFCRRLSLFHILIAVDGTPSAWSFVVIFFFLFLSVWLPCCLSDIVFPLLFVKRAASRSQSS